MSIRWTYNSIKYKIFTQIEHVRDVENENWIDAHKVKIATSMGKLAIEMRIRIQLLKSQCACIEDY